MKHILIIDDDPDEYDIFLTALNDVNIQCKCTWADKADAGLKLLNYVNPDLVFVDQNMPGILGMECIKRIRAMPAHSSTCIILYTTYMDNELQREALAAGATLAFRKPASIEAISSLIDSIVNSTIAKAD